MSAIGKWFTPGIGVKFQFELGSSKGYSKEENWYTQGESLTADDGTSYWKTKYKWWDLNANVMFNLSRLFKGYEGIDSENLKNQFIFSIGLGALHHYGISAQRNEWAGHLELQYSRFFTKAKAVSLDVKLYTNLYQTNFDGVVLKGNGEDSKWWGPQCRRAHRRDLLYQTARLGALYDLSRTRVHRERGGTV